MSEARVPVDLLNPGQVFACLGLMELALTLHGEARAGFDWSQRAAASFVVETPAASCPLADALGFLMEAKVSTVAPFGSTLDTTSWGVATQALPEGAPFPFPLPDSLATLPAVLERGPHRVVIDHWGDGTRRDKVKFWGGSKGKPGAAFLLDALDLVRGRLKGEGDPFNLGAPQKSSFRFDWRRDYIPLDAGFSLNNHKAYMAPKGYPLVEVLAAIGLSHARPQRHKKLEYSYAVIGRAPGQEAERALLPPALLRAALGGGLGAPFETRRFTMQLSWPGQENQARCITTVTEDPQP